MSDSDQQRRRVLEGWGSADEEQDWWRRGRDPIGRHTMFAALFAVLFAALIGALLDPLNLRTEDDLDREEAAAYEIRYQETEPSGYEAGRPFGDVQQMGAEIVGKGEGADTPYGQQFAAGWVDGWNEALAALEASAVEVGLPGDYTEFRVLGAMAER